MKISVCIPVFNASTQHLQEALESALRQKGQFGLEIVVCDDASDTDCEELKSRFPQVRFERNPRNLGMVGNWNHCVGLSSGELVLVLLQDDRIESGMFARYAREFQENPDIVLCACARRFISSSGASLYPRRAVNDRAYLYTHQERYELKHAEVLHLCLRNGNAIGEPSCVMFRKTVYNHIGGYDPAFRHAADLDFNLRAAEQGRIVYLNTPYLLRRLHDSRLTNRNRHLGHLSADRIAIHERHARALNEQGMDLSPYRAYLTACAFKDLLFFSSRRQWKLAGQALTMIRTYGRLRPRTYLRYLLEIAGSRNQDAM